MSLKLTDRVAVQEEGSGGAIHYVPITEFNTLISSEESGRLDDLEAVIGTYEGDNDLSTDVADMIDNISELQDIAQKSIGVIDLSEATEDYEISPEGQVVVLVDNDDPVFDLLLPAATSGLRITISNQDDESVDVAPDGTDTINGVNAAITLATTESATLLCFANGKWAVV